MSPAHPSTIGAALAGPADATTMFELDGQSIEARPGESILAAAKRHGVAIPHLCHRDGYRPDGNCRACVVEIEGERALAPSCCRAPAPGMKVRTEGRAQLGQRGHAGHRIGRAKAGIERAARPCRPYPARVSAG